MLRLVLPKGSLDHKRSVGTVLVVGGSRGMEGAAHMAAFAALRGGGVTPLPPLTGARRLRTCSTQSLCTSCTTILAASTKRYVLRRQWKLAFLITFGRCKRLPVW